MSSVFMKNRMKQIVTYWGAATETDEFGAPDFDSGYPVEIKVRHTDSNERFVDAHSQDDVAEVIMHSAEELSLGGYVFLGAIAELDSSQNPLTQENTYAIGDVKTIKSLSGNKVSYKQLLKGLRGGNR